MATNNEILLAHFKTEIDLFSSDDSFQDPLSSHYGIYPPIQPVDPEPYHKRIIGMAKLLEIDLDEFYSWMANTRESRPISNDHPHYYDWGGFETNTQEDIYLYITYYSHFGLPGKSDALEPYNQALQAYRQDYQAFLRKGF